MIYKIPFKLISIVVLLLALLVSCSSSTFQVDNRKVLIGKWQGQWDDILVELEFQPKNSGSVSYSNPSRIFLFSYEIKADSITLSYPKSIQTYKYTVKKDKLFLSSKESNEESAGIIELIHYTRRK